MSDNALLEYEIVDHREELQRQFEESSFTRICQTRGLYVTSPEIIDLGCDLRIFKETQVKRLIRKCSLVSEPDRKKLTYFSQDETKSEIYCLDDFSDLDPKDLFAIHNVGHATQLIQVPGFNILTDPVFNSLNGFLYPERTTSHPTLDKLVKIDLVLLSHNHRDHLDETSLKSLLKLHDSCRWSQPLVLVPKGDKALVSGLGYNIVEEVEWYDRIILKRELHKLYLVCIPADHRSGRYGHDHHKSLVCGWVINPEVNVIFKFSGDTKPLSDDNQKAVDMVLWSEIKSKATNKFIPNSDIEIPKVICFEPSGPNYTRCDMRVTHQSTSYSALLRFWDARNLSQISGRAVREFLFNIHTILIHHNKFELGPDRFNEGLFVMKKMLNYLNLSELDLQSELERQRNKLEQHLDNQKLYRTVPVILKPIIATLPLYTSLYVHSKDFIIEDIKKVLQEFSNLGKNYIREIILKNTISPLIGKRYTGGQVALSLLGLEHIRKYRQTPLPSPVSHE